MDGGVWVVTGIIINKDITVLFYVGHERKNMITTRLKHNMTRDDYRPTYNYNHCRVGLMIILFINRLLPVTVTMDVCV
jgi:hypothetical protein